MRPISTTVFVLVTGLIVLLSMSGNVVAAYPLNQIVKDLSPVQATVMKGPDGKILINRGAEAGVHVGNLWTIYKKGKPVIDPETGNEIGNLPTPVATAVVVQTEKRFSVIAVKCMAENCLITTGLSARRFHSIPVMFVDPDGRHRDLYEILSSRLPDLRWSAYMNTEVPSSAGSSGYSLVMLARDNKLNLEVSGRTVSVYNLGTTSEAASRPAHPSGYVPVGGPEKAQQPIGDIPGLVTPGLTSEIPIDAYRPVGTLGYLVYDLEIERLDASGTPYFVYLNEKGVFVQAIGQKKRYFYAYKGFGELINISVSPAGLIALNIYDERTRGMHSRVIKFDDGRFLTVAQEIKYIISFLDLDGDGLRESLVGQSFDDEDFFGASVFTLDISKGEIHKKKYLKVPYNFSIFGAFWCDLTGSGYQEIVYYNDGGKLVVSRDGKTVWQSQDKFGGSIRVVDFEYSDLQPGVATAKPIRVWSKPAIMKMGKKTVAAIAANPADLWRFIGDAPRHGGVWILYNLDDQFFLRKLDVEFDGPIQSVFAWGNELFCVVVEGNFFTGHGKTHILAFSLDRLATAIN
ncbi:MAG TPA: hypothetical protein EYP57_05955 [Thermodesulfobacteriaceae bacterium]|nr:hypothetical protein [Thermodesulfobacteriaceae bacterium]